MAKGTVGGTFLGCFVQGWLIFSLLKHFLLFLDLLKFCANVNFLDFF